jgi:hypothetical protein
MGNTITSSAETVKSLDLANGDTKVKQKLTVVGTSEFTGDSTFNGNLSVTNGKVNNVNIPTLGTDVATLKTDLTDLKTTVSSVSTGSFTGKAISGATDVTATGTGTFNSVKTNAIDINGDITSTTGGKYILGNGTTGLFLTNGQTATKAEVLLNKDGSVDIKPSVGKMVKINDIEFTKTKIPFTEIFLSNLTTSGLITASGFTTAGQVNATGLINANGGLTSTGMINANGGITVPTGKTLTANGGVTASALTVNGATTATGALTANGGLTASALTVSGASTLTGATTATGAVTANGGLTASTLTVSGDSTHTGATIATGLITANGGVKSTTITATGDMNAKNIIIGTNKFLIEEVVDTAKGTRLCFGKTDGNTKTFFTCMRADNGNLELF